MAQPLHRYLFRQTFQQSSRFQRTGSPLIRNLRASINKGPARRSFATGEKGPNPVLGKSPFKIWPFVAITLTGSACYVLMVKSQVRKDAEMAPTNPQLPAPKKDHPTFSPDDVIVLFVLGGPGAGKGTQCENLVRDYHFTHLSAGDLLRAEQDRPGSEFGELIKNNIKEGVIVPMEITVQLLENAMTEVINKDKASSGGPKGKGRFLIDGFPRKMDQAVRFEEAVCPSRFVLFFDCPEEEMQRRLLERGKTSGRSDDNEESIRKRFRVFVDTSMPVVEYFEKDGRVVKVDAHKAPEEVYKETKAKVEGRLGKNL